METDLLMVIADWLLEHRPLPFVGCQHDQVPAPAPAPARSDPRVRVIIPDEWVRLAPDRPGMIWMPQSTACAVKLVGAILTLSLDRERSTPDRLFVKWTIADQAQSRDEEWIVTRAIAGPLAIAMANPLANRHLGTISV